MAVQVERWRSLRSADAMDWTKVAVAIWFFVAPWVLGYANATSTAGQAGGGASDVVSAMSWNAWIAAVLLAGIAVCAIAERERWQQWATLMLGAWLFISPWVLGSAYAGLGAISWNFWAVGALMFFISLGEITMFNRTVARMPIRERVGMPERDLAYAGERPRERETVVERPRERG